MLHGNDLLLPKIIASSTDPSHVTKSFHFISITVRISSIKLEIVLAKFLCGAIITLLDTVEVCQDWV